MEEGFSADVNPHIYIDVIWAGHALGCLGRQQPHSSVFRIRMAVGEHEIRFIRIGIPTEVSPSSFTRASLAIQLALLDRTSLQSSLRCWIAPACDPASNVASHPTPAIQPRVLDRTTISSFHPLFLSESQC
jgi:hypothetical protein